VCFSGRDVHRGAVGEYDAKMPREKTAGRDEPMSQYDDPRRVPRRRTANAEDPRPATLSRSRALAGRPRVITLVLRHDGERWRGRLKDVDAREQADADRMAVVRRLQMLAFAHLESAMRDPDAPLVREVVFKVEDG
jgi:hypothetical protein